MNCSCSKDNQDAKRIRHLNWVCTPTLVFMGIAQVCIHYDHQQWWVSVYGHGVECLYAA